MPENVSDTYYRVTYHYKNDLDTPVTATYNVLQNAKRLAKHVESPTTAFTLASFQKTTDYTVSVSEDFDWRES